VRRVCPGRRCLPSLPSGAAVSLLLGSAILAACTQECGPSDRAAFRPSVYFGLFPVPSRARPVICYIANPFVGKMIVGRSSAVVRIGGRLEPLRCPAGGLLGKSSGDLNGTGCLPCRVLSGACSLRYFAEPIMQLIDPLLCQLHAFSRLHATIGFAPSNFAPSNSVRPPA
jgi:hypothetical protein